MLTPDDFRPFLWMLNKKLHEKGKTLRVHINVETNEVMSVDLIDWTGPEVEHDVPDAHDRAHRIAILEEACAEARAFRNEPIAAEQARNFGGDGSEPLWQKIDAFIKSATELLFVARRQ